MLAPAKKHAAKLTFVFKSKSDIVPRYAKLVLKAHTLTQAEILKASEFFQALMSVKKCRYVDDGFTMHPHDNPTDKQGFLRQITTATNTIFNVDEVVMQK